MDPVPGYEGKLYAHRDGRIFSVSKGDFIKQTLHNGYLEMRIQGQSFKCHRLVALTYISNPENKPNINHINGIKNDNRVENLEWCTQAENRLHSIRVLGKNHPPEHMKMMKKLSVASFAKKVDRFSLDGEYLDSFESTTIAGKELGVNHKGIYHAARGKTKTAFGYIWKYA